ncbi:ABC transporter substrate-binding protein [Salarchaeum sp. JOR-1]|uniref:ABC transporter substrate-binding protein n=1 Tax=Salarchaeum sp. JOR-1 TaxID=2599399 RepID=UPI00119847C0|nr:ABC transporter substrate-binding protein [Salarchaeum sp. JOR-1]QDX40968.1 ABC transporter substrate-binding protein [Salarchaeum sp. JOR-1]
MVNEGSQNDNGRCSGNEVEGERNIVSAIGASADRRTFLKGTGAAGLAASAGCLGGGSSSDAPSGTFKVGVLTSHTGTENPIGNSIARSAELAAEELNANGGVLGNDVEVFVKTTNEQPQRGKTKYEELTVSENVDFTTGVFTSEVLLNLMDSIAGQQKVHMTAGAATPEASTMLKDEYEKYKYWFRTGPVNAHFLGANMVDFAEANFSDMGWDSVYVLTEDYTWTEPVDEVLRNQLADAGVEVAGMKRYSGETKDFSTIYDQVEASGADAAFVAMAHSGSTALVQYAKQQRPFAFGGIHVPMQLPSYWGLVNGACAYGVTQNTATPNSEITEKTVPYANAYHDMVGKYPVYTGYIAYDAVKNYAAAAENAGSRNPDDVVAELESMSFTGTAGTVRYYGKNAEYPHDVVYDRTGENGVRPLWLQWKPTESGDGGKQTTIYPDSLAAGEYESPPWV